MPLSAREPKHLRGVLGAEGKGGGGLNTLRDLRDVRYGKQHWSKKLAPLDNRCTADHNSDQLDSLNQAFTQRTYDGSGASKRSDAASIAIWPAERTAAALRQQRVAACGAN